MKNGRYVVIFFLKLPRTGSEFLADRLKKQIKKTLQEPEKLKTRLFYFNFQTFLETLN